MRKMYKDNNNYFKNEGSCKNYESVPHCLLASSNS